MKTKLAFVSRKDKKELKKQKSPKKNDPIPNRGRCQKLE